MRDLYSQVDVMPGASAPVVTMPMASAFPEDDWFYESLVGGNASESGVTVTPSTALSHGAVWQAVNLLQGDVGLLPLHKMRRDGRSREKDRKHPLWWLFTQQPNDLQTPAMWKETMIQWSLLWGNAINYIDWGGPLGTVPQQLIPLQPDRTSYIKVNGQYLITTWLDNRYFLFHPWECFHIAGLARNGFWGESCVQVAKNVIAHGIALRKHGNATFKHGAVPRAVMTNSGKVPKDIREGMRDEWNAMYGGVDNQGKIALLQQGTDVKTLSLSNVDAQWLEASKLDREFVAALFNLPNHKLNALENAAVRANLEEQNLQYLMMSLARHLNKIKEEAERKLLTERERRSDEHYFKWVVDSFLRGNTKDRYEAYSKGRIGGWLSKNDVREFEDMNPVEGGDDYSNPAINPDSTDKEVGDSADNADEKENLARARRLIGQVAQAMFTAEDNKVLRAARGGGNFVEWLDQFYSDYLSFAAGFLDAPLAAVGVFVDVKDWRTILAAHGEARLEKWLLLSGEVPQEQLGEAVARNQRPIPDQPPVGEFLARKLLGEV